MRRFWALFVESSIITSCSAGNNAQLEVKSNTTINVSSASVFQSTSFGYFNGFGEKDINQPGGYSFINNPTENSVFKKVQSFSVEPGCNSNITYDDGKSSDCIYGSVWAEFSESGVNWPDLQPDKAWYGWDIYIPKDFPTA